MKNPYGPCRKQCRKCQRILDITVFRKQGAVCRRCLTAQQKVYSDAHRDSVNTSSRSYYRRNAPKINAAQTQRYHRQPEVFAAHKRVAEALAKGTLKKEHCARCGRKDTHAHHKDYSKPLEVVWLCPKCHRQEHRRAAA